MDRIISLLLFAAFFYIMMRFGCGAHMVHGHHHHGQQGTGPGAGGSSKRRCPFSERFRRHFSLRPSVVIEICSALHSPYPAGNGSAAIFRSMLANSRRVRWLSAKSSQ
jgi:hypothetical protein